MQPLTVDAFQYRCYRIAVYDSISPRDEQYLPDGRRYDQFPAPATGSRATMAIDERRVKRFFRKEKRNAERAVDAAKSDIKRTVNDVQNAFRPPWYKRMWNSIKRPFTRRQPR
ncbi:hypothetical protein OESDEN_01346 [Oesophagostomum dentatum]|uniref:Uncharacterized protein n=1 Tax=Oesophagostomum dentatum TaxID=61180 RepID=A0A0B1TN60_OESDE|nr:hypothetical protein OESDEN_01346 [Oesophagostomum dentatum]